MDTIRIPLGRSGTAEAWATIDFEDYERVALYRWYLNASGYPFVAYSKNMGRTTTYLHNYVLRRENGSGDGKLVDHIDRNPLNNCKGNLRVVTQTENMTNTSTNDRMRRQARDFRDAARRLRELGVPIRVIAHGLGISESSVSRYCEGITDYPGRRRTHPWTREEILERFRWFRDVYGRLPVRADLGTNGLPWRDNFLRYFASLDDAYAAM